MSKKKRRPSHQPTGRSASPRLHAALAEAAYQLDQGHLDRAAALADELDHLYPGNEEVLGLVAEVAYTSRDMERYLGACERLYRRAPDDPQRTLALAAAYLLNIRPALALRTFRRFLERWPDHPDAEEARQTVREIEDQLRRSLQELGVGDDLELAVQHEEINTFLNQGNWAQVRALADTVLRKKPDFVPVLNNLSLAYAMEGRMAEAIETAGKVLALQADNFHALANMTRFLLLSGRIEEAAPYAERLKAVQSTHEDIWAKKAEVFAFLGDDQAVLDAFEGARRGGPEAAPPLLYHLAGVAALRLGREKEARAHWQQALKRSPGLDLAKENLEDLRRPVGERHAPWPYSFPYWVPRRLVDAFFERVRSAVDRDAAATADNELRRFVTQYQPFVRLIPLLLDRGDPFAREFALRAATLLKTPETLAMLRDFALGQRGPDEARHRAMQAVQEAGLWPSGPVPMWVEGEWRDIMGISFEIIEEPIHTHDPQVEEWKYEAGMALRAGEAARAEELLRKALEVDPDAPDLLNNLAVARAQQGHIEESEAMVRQIHLRFPDYLFARVAVARMQLRDGQVDQADATLQPLLSRGRLHVSEFDALMDVRLQLLEARKQVDGIESWLDIWEELNPESEGLARWRERLGLLQLSADIEKLAHGWRRPRRSRRR